MIRREEYGFTHGSRELTLSLGYGGLYKNVQDDQVLD
jgi:hypothetical protein